MGDFKDIDDEAVDGDMVSESEEEMGGMSGHGGDSDQGRLVSGMASLTMESETR